MITPAWVLLLPKHLGVQSGVGMPSPTLLLPCNSFPALTTVSRAGQITARKPNQPDPEAGSRRARASDILLTRDAYKIEPGWACRAEPGSGVGDVPPDPARILPSICFRSQRRSTAYRLHYVVGLAVQVSPHFPDRAQRGAGASGTGRS